MKFINFKVLICFLLLAYSSLLRVESNLKNENSSKQSLGLAPSGYNGLFRITADDEIAEIRVNGTPVSLLKVDYLKSIVDYSIIPINAKLGDTIEVDAINLGGPAAIFGVFFFKDINGNYIAFPTSEQWKCTPFGKNTYTNALSMSSTYPTTHQIMKNAFYPVEPIWDSSMGQAKGKVTCKFIVNYQFADKGSVAFKSNNNGAAGPVEVFLNSNQISTSSPIENSNTETVIAVPLIKPGDEINLCTSNTMTKFGVASNNKGNPAGLIAKVSVVDSNMTVQNYKTDELWQCEGKEPLYISTNSIQSVYSKSVNFNLSKVSPSAYFIWDKSGKGKVCCSLKIPRDNTEVQARKKTNALLRILYVPFPLQILVNGIQVATVDQTYPYLYSSYIVPIRIELGDKLEIVATKGNSFPISFMATLTLSDTNQVFYTDANWTCNNIAAVVTSTAANTFEDQYPDAKNIKFDYNNIPNGGTTSCYLVLKQQIKTLANIFFQTDDTTKSVSINGSSVSYLMQKNAPNQWDKTRQITTLLGGGDEIEICFLQGGTSFIWNSNPGDLSATINYVTLDGIEKKVNTDGSWQCKASKDGITYGNYVTPNSLNTNGSAGVFLNANKGPFSGIDLNAFFLWPYDTVFKPFVCCKTRLNQENYLLNNVVMDTKATALPPNKNGIFLVGDTNVIGVSLNGIELEDALTENIMPLKPTFIELPNLKEEDVVEIEVVKGAQTTNPSMNAEVRFNTLIKTQAINVTDNTWKCGEIPATVVPKMVPDCSNMPQGMWIWGRDPKSFKVKCSKRLERPKEQPASGVVNIA